MKDVDALISKIVDFRDARDWKKFHNAKDLALSLVLEANEVMEHFQWKNNEEITGYLISKKEEIGEELADVLYWVLLMSHDFDIDIVEALHKKLQKNETKYPVEKSKGRHTKYNKL
jgi:NTP pyrophosphatase (non-canonical NTP hydrolase)